MRLIVLTVMGLMAGLGLAAAIVSVPVMAEKGPLRDTLVAHLGGAQEEVQGGGAPYSRGRAVVKVFKEQLCARVETSAIETSSSKVTIHLGMSGEKGPTVATLEERAATPTTGTTTGTTTGDSTLPQATTAQTTTVGQTSLSQSTASATASASASASASALAATTLEHTGGCVAVPRALSLELLEHPRRFYVNVTNGQSPGAIRGQLHRGGHDNHRSGDAVHSSGDGDDD